MGTHVDTINCPNCGSEDLNLVIDTRPFERTWGLCHECGFQMYPKYSQMALDLLNDYRKEWNNDYDYSESDEEFKHPLKELPPFTEPDY